MPDCMRLSTYLVLALSLSRRLWGNSNDYVFLASIDPCVPSNTIEYDVGYIVKSFSDPKDTLKGWKMESHPQGERLQTQPGDSALHRAVPRCAPLPAYLSLFFFAELSPPP